MTDKGRAGKNRKRVAADKVATGEDGGASLSRNETAERQAIALKFTTEGVNNLATVVSLYQDRLEGHGMSVARVYASDDDAMAHPEECHVLKVWLSQARLEQVAESIRMMKRLKTNEFDAEFTCEDGHLFQGYGTADFFVPMEQIHLISVALDRIVVGPSFFKELGKESQRVRSSIVHAGSVAGVLEVVTPMHTPKARMEIWKKASRSWWTSPVDLIRDYHGEEVAFYFLWMDFFTTWLLGPAVVGTVLYYWQSPGRTVDDASMLPFFSIFVVIWAAAFLQFWKRRAARKAVEWNSFDASIFKLEVLRPEFDGVVRTSPVTGQPELWFPEWKRIPRYAVSVVVTSVMLVVAFVVMVCSLNLQGYIRPHEPFLYVPFLSRFSQPGAIFDPENAVMALVPVLLHSTVILGLNTVYSSIAGRLTDWENHRTERQHENALILKRFLFEAFDGYIALAYLAFWELSAVKLRSELVALYTTDSLRRVMMESVIPWLTRKVSVLMSNSDSKGPERDGGPPNEPSEYKRIADQCDLLEYSTFDDYLEMILSYGYVTLFASALPLGALFTVICNIVELKNDAFKLTYVHRRPIPMRTADLGTWFKVMQSMMALSILTNCLIIGFGSEQLGQWMPQFYDLRDDGDEYLKAGMGRFAVGLVFGVEHVLMVVAFGIRYLIPRIPSDVMTELQRRDYEREEAAIAVRHMNTHAKDE